jgi:anti-sigma factor RsiW
MSELDCPLRSVLLDFCLGRLPPDRIDQVHRHLEACPTCTQQVAALDNLPVPFLTHLRQVRDESSAGYSLEPEFQQALRRVKELRTWPESTTFPPEGPEQPPTEA